MFIRAFQAQVRLLLRKKEAKIVFCVLLALCLSNYVGNVFAFQGSDVLEMIHPAKLLLLSYNRVWNNADATLFLIQIYPFLVVCAAGFSMVGEQHAKQEAFLISRVGPETYYFSKLAASFTVTAIVFSLPFLTEFLLNCVAFPLNAMGDFSNLSYYDADYREMVGRYLLSELFVKAPYLYTILFILFFGLMSGVLGAFATAVSFLIRFKYRIFLFFPTFILLNGTLYLEGILPGLRAEWYRYLLLFCDEEKNLTLFVLGFAGCVGFSVAAAFVGSRREVIG